MGEGASGFYYFWKWGDDYFTLFRMEGCYFWNGRMIIFGLGGYLVFIERVVTLEWEEI